MFMFPVSILTGIITWSKDGKSFIVTSNDLSTNKNMNKIYVLVY